MKLKLAILLCLAGLVVGVWAVAGALAALAGILVSPRTTLDPYLILFVTIWALAGSILGGLESFGIAFVTGCSELRITTGHLPVVRCPELRSSPLGMRTSLPASSTLSRSPKSLPRQRSILPVAQQ